MKNIILAGLIYDNNLGDQAIYQSTRYMLDNILSEFNIDDVEIRGIDVTGRDGMESNRLLNRLTPQNLLLRIYRRFVLHIYDKQKAERKLKAKEIPMVMKALCKNNIDKNTMAIIFAGGGIIKYKYQFFHYYINEMTAYADKLDIPVMFSAVGVEGYDGFNCDCMLLKEAINRKCVKVITTRDDLDTLNNSYCTGNIATALVADPACSINSIYRSEKKFNRNKKNIGLGVVRENLFIDYGVVFQKHDMLKLWAAVYKELINRGYSCRLFCNGAKSDLKFAYDLAEYMGWSEEEKKDYIMKRPTSTKELIDEITDFDAVIAGRLHASIIAYAYGIPSVGLVWNNKQIMFGKIIGYPERFIASEEFNAERIIDTLEKALKEGYNEDVHESYCATTEKELKGFIETYIKR